MRRVLVVAYYFPPIAGIGSIRLASFARYLPEFGWEPTVLAPERTPHPQDPSIAFPEAKVVRSRSIELSRLARAVPRGDGGSDPRARSWGESVRARGRRFVYPDAQIGWFPWALRAGRRMLRDGRFDAIYSSSYPITAHLVGRRLSQRSGLPWIAEFRDPWSDLLPSGHPHRARAARLEAEITTQAARAVMPSPSWAEHFAARWGTEIDVIRNGHELRPQAPSSHRTEPTLVHLGSFYPGRQSLTPVLAALEQMADSRDRPMPRVIFIGELDPSVRAEAAEAGIRVETTGLVSHEEALEILTTSSMAFAIGGHGRDPITRGWIPAKLVEYLASELPVLYVGDPSGDAAALLAGQTGCVVAEPGDSDAIVSALEEGLAGHRHRREIENLSRRSAAELLARSLTVGAED